MPSIDPSKRFEKALKKLDKQSTQHAIEALTNFVSDPKHPGLNFEKVQGKPGQFTIRTNGGNRICLSRTGRQQYVVVDVGTHDYIYKKYG
jgi:hypothetical protein